MSIAGIRSNRGDGYQTLIAFDWALTVLSDHDFQWIEIDSVTYPVDDVVVGKTDGSVICCQCKKNQIDHKAWKITDLSVELDKAARLLESNQKAEIRFYSRSPFGELAKLREHSITQHDEISFSYSLGKELKKIYMALAVQLALQSPHLSAYDFLRRTIFETSPELDRMENKLHERLRFIASNHNAAFDALWTRLDKLGARMDSGDLSSSAQHRLTKDDLKAVLHQAGAMLAPRMILADVRTSFASTSAIGRSWHRDIAGQRISTPVLDDLISAIDAKKCSILLTGPPGCGKTCVMLALQDTLEQRAQASTDIVPLFIQSREFADLATAQDRQALGLSEQWIEEAARMAEEAHVVVVIDSLDVLSIARDHTVLTYFLAQIDRLLLIPKITVVTACRDFDRNYDRRIAERQWDCEFKCQPLNWETEIEPLLHRISVNSTTIDAETRKLIQNPHELALFVELAQREGSFNVVTSQALAQRYLDTIVREDDALGEIALQAIENIANEMLKLRKLALPYQRFTASQDIRRLLCSLNVLQETQYGELMFGHQTLLDVLVISGAVRHGVTLNEFIRGLPQVPFVRPSIRSFVAYLAMGTRREFRKQLRTVLTGIAAFHIRRLVAESFAEQIPQDDDWPLINELRDKHRDIFQVVYTQARLVEWHRFWFKHLVPILKDKRDAEGLTTHVYRVSQWQKEDSTGVLTFWMEILQLDWIDRKQIAGQLAFYLSKIDTDKMDLVASLAKRLLNMPREEHNMLGHAIARCVEADAMDDNSLWQYIAGDINDEDVIKFRFDKKLHCQAHEFGKTGNEFLLQRMKKSTTLLDPALASIERWSQIKSSQYRSNYKGHHSNFLSLTSYENSHSQHEHHHKDCDNILFDAIEAAIISHANTHSDWWQVNRERLCFNREDALRYFAILACTANPKANIEMIGRMLSNKDMMASSLSYELSTLMQASFIYLDTATQDKVMGCILTLREDSLAVNGHYNWILKERVDLIVTIPHYLRSPKTKELLEDYENKYGMLIRQPHIGVRSGMVSPPFTYEIFHHISDSGVLSLLEHYTGHKRDFDDFLVGGAEQVGRQLNEASSRQPTRFLHFLSTYWDDISEEFRDDIMDGIAIYLAHRYGNLQTNGKWEPLENPDASILAIHILDELEKHPDHWHRNRSASNALKACAHILNETQNAERLVFLAIGYAGLQEESTIKGDSVDLVTTGINMMSGHIAEALMIVANKFQENSIPFPELLSPTLCRFAGHEHPAIRALILRHLPYLQSKDPELGWDLFYRAMQDASGLWQIAEPCLYYAYHNNYDKIAPLLMRIRHEGSGKELETWGRISALAALSRHIAKTTLLNDLKEIDNSYAWRGASSVWTHPENIREHREQCLEGIVLGLKANGDHAGAVAQHLERLFRKNNSMISIPLDSIKLYFTILESNSENKQHHLFWFDEWLNAISTYDPVYALDVAEIYLDYVNRVKPYFYDHENNLTQLMTCLFSEAEEREEADQGIMLRRVVSLQDMLLSLGLDSINNWLRAAERP